MPTTPDTVSSRTVRSRRRSVIAAGVLAATAALAGTAWLASHPAEASHPAASPDDDALPAAAQSVDIVRPEPRTLARTLTAAGSLWARDELLVGSDASGVRLLEMTVDVGASVKRGQLLARGDDAPLQAQRAQQVARVRQARAEGTQAEANLERAERIKDSGVYSAETVQTRRSAAEAAAAALQLAEAQQRETELRIAQTRVHAPADGVISRRSATVGAVMQPGQELFRLIRDHEIEWRAELPDHALHGIEPGAAVQVRIAAGPAIEGRVRLVAPTVDAHTRNGIVHVSLPRPATAGADPRLRAGAHAQGEIRTGSANALTLPEPVVLMKDGQPFVYVVGERGVARATRVQTGTRHDGRVEVIGLDAGMRVVATGGGFVKDGERVRVVATPVENAPREGARS